VTIDVTNAFNTAPWRLIEEAGGVWGCGIVENQEGKKGLLPIRSSSSTINRAGVRGGGGKQGICSRPRALKHLIIK